MIVRKNKVQQLDDGSYHPQDLMAHKLRDHIEAENRKALTFLKKDDDRLTVLFKHYETIQSYQHAFEELIKKAKEYREQEEQEAHFTLKASEIKKIQDNLDEMKERANAFNIQFANIKETVMSTFQTQLKEYVTAVDNNPAIGIDRNMAPTLKKLHNKVDDLLAHIDKLKNNAADFIEKYEEQLEEKEKFYKKDKEFEKKQEKKKDPEQLKLTQKVIEDISYGAENLRIQLKEKYLGRLPGTKRGET